MKRWSTMKSFPHPEEGLRAMASRAPQATAYAASRIASWSDRLRPTAASIYGLRRRIATIAVALLAASLFVHVMFGANGMVVYRQKRAEYEGLRKQIVQVQQENDRYSQQIQSLKSDQKAIEKEAREQLGYAKPGEYVYVPPVAAKPAPSATRSAKK